MPRLGPYLSHLSFRPELPGYRAVGLLRVPKGILRKGFDFSHIEPQV